ncbi:MAG TPA: flavin reductase family protein [Candidatus Desulfovibrio intestinipullorum]|uniref:Flavin reductase family protein n=1 Tax=Candidatus Desulfovibrio intestinipullorum TaxID=2838536 RepID=A0A9D1TPQ4_9BACT|nr:flavin reductase family protein [Candidatus Desulfovibrio intestinipullorum]
MKKEIQPFEYAKEITSAIGHGILVTTKNGDRVNTMTIGWGTLGVMWSLPMFMIYIREGRFTREQLDASGEFTVNIPWGSQSAKKITAYCGSRSGRDFDKIKDMGLTLVESDLVGAPGIAELPLTLECKVLYRQLLDKNAVPEDIRKTMYPENVDSSNPMANRDYHVAYFGKILKAYIIE